MVASNILGVFEIKNQKMGKKEYKRTKRTVLMIFPELFTIVMVCSRGMMNAARGFVSTKVNYKY